MRFRKYICPKADKTNQYNSDGCSYPGFMERDNDLCVNCGMDYNATRTIWYKIELTFPYWIRRTFQHPIKDAKRQWRFFWQRRFRGFDDSELWDLSYTHARLMWPRIKAFIDTYGARSVPRDPWFDGAEDTQKEWLRILEKICRSFELTILNNKYDITEEERKDIEEGLDLFRKWYHHLWD